MPIRLKLKWLLTAMMLWKVWNGRKMRCCPKDLADVLRESGVHADVNVVRNILKDNWGLTSEKNGEYSFYHIGTDGEIVPMKRKGRYMEIALADIDEILL